MIPPAEIEPAQPAVTLATPRPIEPVEPAAEGGRYLLTLTALAIALVATAYLLVGVIRRVVGRNTTAAAGSLPGDRFDESWSAPPGDEGGVHVLPRIPDPPVERPEAVRPPLPAPIPLERFALIAPDRAAEAMGTLGVLHPSDPTAEIELPAPAAPLPPPGEGVTEADVRASSEERSAPRT